MTQDTTEQLIALVKQEPTFTPEERADRRKLLDAMSNNTAACRKALDAGQRPLALEIHRRGEQAIRDMIVLYRTALERENT